MDKILEIKNLTVDYVSLNSNSKKALRAVDDVSLFINKGEIYALAGESGCGKSTIAKTITRLVTPISGEILFENKNILQYSKRKYNWNLSSKPPQGVLPQLALNSYQISQIFCTRILLS